MIRMPMIRMRSMLPEGESRFREYLQQVRQNSSIQRPDLNQNQFSEEFSPYVSIDETRTFLTKLELAEYLDRCFKNSNITRKDVLGEKKKGLWTWLAYIWFDQLAPGDNAGIRNIKEEAKYICSSNYRDYYRHLIAGPYDIFSLHGMENSRIFLYSPVHEHNDFIEQFASRQFIISHPNIVETITKLYLDAGTKKPKRGAQSKKKEGNIRRFVKIIQQFELTFDIYSMSSEQILKLLPDEFDEWRKV